MMGWFGPSGNCGCCEPPKCNCPGGGVSRKFRGEPTFVIEVDGLPDVYEWDSVVTIFPASGPPGTPFWDTVTLTGLDALNGTYVVPLSDAFSPAVDGCIGWGGSNSTHAVTSLQVSNRLIRRTLTGTTGCTIFSTEDTTVNVNAGIDITKWGTDGYFEISLWCFRFIPVFGINRQLFSLTAIKHLHCYLDYDYSLAPGEVAGTPPNYEYADPGANLRKAANASGRCFSASSDTFPQIGTMTAEIIDDVP